MAASIFVDIATPDEVAEGNVASLSEFFRQHINKNSDANIHTKPAVVLIEDDTLKIFSTGPTFVFETATGDISYDVYKKERSRTDIFEKCFDGDFHYILNNYRRDSSPVILALTTMFISFFGDGNRGMKEVVSTISRGRFDYDENQKGEYRFWHRRQNGDWGRSSLCLFTDYLYNTTRSFIEYDKTDDYLYDRLSKKGNEHTGYLFISYATYLALKRRKE